LDIGSEEAGIVFESVFGWSLKKDSLEQVPPEWTACLWRTVVTVMGRMEAAGVAWFRRLLG
jgi:hypothetical protein